MWKHAGERHAPILDVDTGVFAFLLKCVYIKIRTQTSNSTSVAEVLCYILDSQIYLWEEIRAVLKAKYVLNMLILKSMSSDAATK